MHLEHLDLVESDLERAQRARGLIGARIPARGLGIASQIFEHRGVCAEELGAPRECLLRVQLGDLKFEQSLLGLAQIEARARNGDREVDTLLRVELRHVGFLCRLDGLLGAAETALAVDHQSQVAVEAAQPAVGAQLAQCEREVTGAVGRDRERLSSDRDAARATARRQRVLVSKLGLLVDQVRDHCEVFRNAILHVSLQRLQLVAC